MNNIIKNRKWLIVVSLQPNNEGQGIFFLCGDSGLSPKRESLSESCGRKGWEGRHSLGLRIRQHPGMAQGSRTHGEEQGLPEDRVPL